MATTSMNKDFIITDKEAFEQFRRDVQKAQESRPKEVKESPSLYRGREKLEQFSFR